MDLAYLRVIAATHLAFAVVFAFFFWQKRTRFAGALTCAWLIQALRVVPLMRQAGGAGVPMWEWLLADLLLPPAMLCLLASGAELSTRRLRGAWGLTYVGVSALVITVGHLRGSPLAERWFGLTADRAVFWAVFVRHMVVFVPGGLAIVWLAWTLLRCWFTERLPGGLIAALGAVPYAIGVLAIPAQWWFSYYPHWALLAWFLQVLGLSTGLLTVILNLEHVALERSQENVRRLQGLLPICAWCRRIRDEQGRWSEIEVYVRDHSEASFTHGLCPDCLERVRPRDPNGQRQQPAPASAPSAR